MNNIFKNMTRNVEAATTAKAVFEHVKLDYTNLSIGIYDNISFDFKFKVSALDYLKYAQKDIRNVDPQSLINALSNAKRSIDCLIEMVLRSLSINPDNIGQSELDFCARFLSKKEQDVRPYSLRLFSALGFAPSFMISEVRNIRNKVEHEFHIPDEQDVIRAIEVAELLINNVKAKEIYSATIDISDIKRYNRLGDGFITGIYFYKDDFTSDFYLSGSNSKGEKIEYKFKPDDAEYLYLLRAMFTAEHDTDKLENTIYNLLELMNIKTPSQHRKINNIHR
ncbi:hypothetical protein NMD63_09930 [Edwardsiella tarda]|uniref:hypothetical protein n=1 Tax=Edwardsiella tarda TaxID=636 RepID=UPI00351C3329